MYTVYFGPRLKHNVIQMGQWLHMDSPTYPMGLWTPMHHPTCPMVQWDMGAQMRQWIHMDSPTCSMVHWDMTDSAGP